MILIRSAFALTALASLAAAAHGQLSYYAGTGHYYQAVYVPTGITWLDANAAAKASGGYLASILSQDENDFVYSLVNTDAFFTTSTSTSERLGPWFGAQNVTGTTSFSWTSGEAVGYTNWRNGQPDGFGGGTQYGQFYAGAGIGSTWGDDPSTSPAGYGNPKGYVVEFNVNPTPEPATFAALGLGALAWVKRRKRA